MRSSTADWCVVRRTAWRFAFIVAALLWTMAASSLVRATDIAAGDDLWVTPVGGSWDLHTLPAGFFTSTGGEASEAYLGGMRIEGAPLASNISLALGSLDTVVRRKAPATPLTCPGTDTVPIELVALSLVSSSPITVTYPSGATEDWNVQICKSATAVPLTAPNSMTISHRCANGGDYTAVLSVRPRFTFTRTTGGAGSPIVHDATDAQILTFNSAGWWSHIDKIGGLLVTPAGSMVDTDCNGTLDTSIDSTPGPEGFFPGLFSDNCVMCAASGTFKKPMSPEEEMLAAHGVFLANQEKRPTDVVGACCAGGTLNGQCFMTGQTQCQTDYSGTWVGAGTQCNPNPCLGGPICGNGTCDGSQGETPCTCPLDCGQPSAGESGLCTDGIDNDCDGAVDCADSDCAADPGCHCPNGACEAALGEDQCTCPQDCGNPPNSEAGSCNDIIDNDCDGAVDCDDSDCAADPVCGGALKCVGPGQDCFTTACDGKTKYDFSLNPIPVDFFCAGSDPFMGVVTLGGAGGFPGDTVIRRPAPICHDDTALPDTETVPIELVQLSLVSCSPIAVSGCPATQTNWDVYVGLPPGQQPSGTLSATKTDASGGTFTSSLPVNAEVRFGPAGSGAPTTQAWPAATVVLSMACASPWLQNCPTGVCDFGCGSNGFSAGWDLDQNNQPCCRETCHANPAGGHEHCTTPPDCTPCPTAGKLEDCNDEIDNDGDGLCDCADPDCATLPKCGGYKNWVIADDFMIGCGDCTCDLNRDGICDTLDDVIIHDCQINPNPPAICRNGDYDCDGDVDYLDDSTWYCLFNGNPPDVCCANPKPRPEVNKIRWYGSYLDPAFDPSTIPLPPGGVRKPDGWYVALHSDLPPVACPIISWPGGTAATKPVDLCGTLEQGVGSGCIMFRPKGSAFVYNILNTGALAPYVVGDMVRICGYIDNSNPTTCQQGIGNIQVNAAMDCDTKVSRPDRLIAQWYFPDIPPEQTGKVGWDNHTVFCYTVDLGQGCLIHNNAGFDEIPNPNGPFFPRNNRTYWLSIQAEVGAVWNKVSPGLCEENKTVNTIDREFWGWHTTPPGYQQKDDAYMGQIRMGCPEEWLYEWMGHLHCSDNAAYRDCCDDPTKSIDMAFYLLRARRGVCVAPDSDITCNTDADCPQPGFTCVAGLCQSTPSSIACADNVDCPPGYTCEARPDITWWCQPVNGGPPNPGDFITPLPRPFPIGGIDELANTFAEVDVNIFGDQLPTLRMSGPTVVARGPAPQIPEPMKPARAVIETEMLALDLRSSDGTILRLNRDAPRSVGQTLAGTGGGGDPYPADSFFDIFIEIELPEIAGVSRECVSIIPNIDLCGQICIIDSDCPLGCRCANVLISGNAEGTGPGPVRLSAQINEIPPGPTRFDLVAPVPLLKKGSLEEVGTIKFVGHEPPYRGGFNIHSDTDWENIPADDCCEPDPTSSTLCTQPICPNTVPPANERCRPTMIANGAALDCLCQEDSKCHLEFNTVQGTCSDGMCVAGAVGQTCTTDADCDTSGPVCVNPCPDPALVCTLLGSGTAADPYDCDCRPAPVCEPNSTGTACTPCPIAGQECVPKKVKCTPGTTSCSIVACECKDQNCHVDLNAAGLPYCVNQCPDPPGDTCALNGVDSDGDGVNDLWDCICDPPPPGCEPNSAGTDCNPTACPAADEKCKKKCVILDTLTGAVRLSDCDCVGPNECHMEFAGPSGSGGNVAGEGAPPLTGDCMVADDGSGTVKLPPDGCPYLSPEEFHKIIDGLPEGVTIEIGAIHKNFICNRQPADPTFCSFTIPDGVDCDDQEPNDFSDGAKECHESTLELHMRGTGMGNTAGPSTYLRMLSMPARMETHTGPRQLPEPVQSFDTDMFRLQGQLPIGDPDFDLLRITAGTGFGMPSPGHTTLTKMGGNWAVDSFFDITYEIEYIGAPGGPFAGMSGSTTGTIRMATKPFKCADDCPEGFNCVETRTPISGTTQVKVCCECVEKPQVCEPELPDRQRCVPDTCPPGIECKPKRIQCFPTPTGPGCEIVECDCNAGNQCHPEMPPLGATEPICVGTCPLTSPPNTKCVPKRIPLAGGGKEYTCRCLPIPSKPVASNPPGVPGMNRHLGIEHEDIGAVTAGPGILLALRITPLELQHPNPRNLPRFDPPDFSKFDTNVNGTCVGGDYDGHPCNTDADCVRNMPTGSDGVCSNFQGCTEPGEMNGCGRWAGAPATFMQYQGPPASGPYRAARLQCAPDFHDWSMESNMNLVGAEILPSSQYAAQFVDISCADTLDEECFSEPLILGTARYGDVASPFNPPDGTQQQPNALDVAGMVLHFKQAAGSPPKSVAQIQPNVPDPNADVSALDIVQVVDAVKELQYRFSGPCACPSVVTCGGTACGSSADCVMAFGPGAMCVLTCSFGDNAGQPCINNSHCPPSGVGICGGGFCRDRCGRCKP